ncbi:protein TPX2 [Morus notabilis]|uniref:protein TPX2 n=1 Tax=Morus notabilis TaxID=981085 RepID=UPI000CED7B24|nr:protein TPX2 [Morus notabilis]
MEMEEDMEVEPVFEAHEIDLEYEFEAARYFDFTREETPVEAREAENWFESANSYPPSPFATKLVLGEDILLENVNISPKAERENQSSTLYGGGHVGGGQDFCSKDVNNRDCEAMERGIFGNLQKVLNQPHGASSGLYNYLFNYKPKGKTNPSTKKSLPRSSTLLKPTASQLAKQNRPPQVGSSRFQMPLVHNSEKSLCSLSGPESQAPKRQKLEAGHLRKVTDEKQQTNFVHKIAKKDDTVLSETVDKVSAHAKLKLTIPREPELKTAHRAERMRPRSVTEVEQVTTAVRRFKARPLNRKIFKAPSLPLPKRSTPKLPEFQVFHLKTMERAMQNVSTASFSNTCNDTDKGQDKPSTSNMVENANKESRRPITLEALKQDGAVMHKFKALPLNKKIFSSKGDIGVFRNSKREPTIPMEFNFQTERRIQHNPPTDLFSKLSLTSELQPNNRSHPKWHQSNSSSAKGSKENKLDSFQPENKVTDPMIDKTSIFGRKQTPCGSDGGISEISNRLHTRRMGIL